ncbi:MAG: hypothetical protein CMJ01_04280 [Pelagibacteraceae bacterium]|nr:hypothetical protein [Pelagibacteraceae bacterium]
MLYRFVILFIILSSCASNYNYSNPKTTYNSKGFAYIYNESDFNNKLIKTKFNNMSLEVSHDKLKRGALIKIINPKNNKSIILMNKKKSKYPDLYNILITEAVLDNLKLNKDLPFVEIIEVKKNKSFVAKKTKMFKEEEKTFSNAPVELVKIDNISKNKKKDKISNNRIYIVVAEFYSRNSANLLKKRITKELPNLESKKMFIKTKKLNKTSLLMGPYSSVNLMKNDYIQLQNFGFEEMDISINE